VGQPLEDGGRDGISELDALRRRAYGPDADIFTDADALARLTELEEQVRCDRSALSEEPARDAAAGATSEPSMTEPPAFPVAPTASPAEIVAISPARAPRWHVTLIAATAAIALLLGGAAWSADRAAVTDGDVANPVDAAAELNSERDAAYRASYRMYLEGLRDEALSLPGGEEVAERMIRASLRPYGILYGRTVAVGPTTDHRFCMIIADLPEASVTCIPVENAYANPVTVALPAWYSDADSDLFTGLGELVAYTLMPGGSVVAEPADAAAAAGATVGADVPVVENDGVPDEDAAPPTPAPQPTAVPPPGWQ
jgi:hypothetical protein